MTPQGTADTAKIEHRLLELAYTTNVVLTAPALAYFAPASIIDAERVLEGLVAKNQLHMEVDEQGGVFFVMPNRPTPVAALVPAKPLATGDPRPVRPAIAALLSLFVPGAGQLYDGRPFAALLWFIAVGAGYWLIVPGLILHFFCVISAAAGAHRVNTIVARQLRA